MSNLSAQGFEYMKLRFLFIWSNNFEISSETMSLKFFISAYGLPIKIKREGILGNSGMNECK